MFNLKRAIALVLTVLMLMSMAACSGNEDPTQPKDTSKETTAPQNAEPTAEPTTAPPAEQTGELLQTSRWSLRYDPKLWVMEEDALEDDDYQSEVSMEIPDPEEEDEYLVSLEVSAMVTDHDNFRSNLRSENFDAYEYAVNHTYETVNVGGVDFLLSDGDEDYAMYFMRLEGAGVDVEIEIYGDKDHEAVTSVLESLSFTIEDVGNVDAPWPWDGTPYAAEPGEEVVGTYTLNSVQIPFAESIVTNETFDHNIAVLGEDVYVINDGAAKKFSYDGTTLTFAADLELGDEYEHVDPAADGTVWFSGFMAPLINWNGSSIIASYDDTDRVAMHPDGTWGINWFSDNEIKKLTLANGVVTDEAYTLAEVDIISHLCVSAQGDVFVCGSDAEDDEHRVYVYNDRLELQTVLQDSDGTGLGSATFATRTENGFLVLDGNMRELLLYTADGTYIGVCDFTDLFGTYYPWACGACVADDGSILIIMTDERPDESADEVIVFKLTGF